MKSKELSKPRNFVAKNSKMGMGGAGAHKDKKKAMKQGDVKHKKKDLPESLEYRLAQKVQEYIEQGVAEGSEFGAYYYEKVAQEIFDKRQDITSEDEVLNQAYHIVSNEQGQKSARYMFNYDEDFPSDVVSAYFWLQKHQGVAEAMSPQQQHDFDRMRAGAMSRQAYDAKWKKPRKSDDEVIYGKRKGVAEDTIRPNLVAALKGIGFKGPFKLGQLPEWMAELQDAQFDEETSIMIGGDDPAYDPWVAKGYGYGYAYGMEGGYQTELSAQQVFKQAKGDMEGMAEGRKDYGYDDAGFSLRPGHDEGEPVYNPRYDRTGQYDRKSKYSQDYNYRTGKPLGAAKPAQKKGYIFYNVNDPQTAIKLGLKQTKSGKWYLPADDTHRQATADKVFGKGRYWEPK